MIVEVNKWQDSDECKLLHMGKQDSMDLRTVAL